MAEDHKSPQLSLLLHRLKSQQGTQGFAGSWAGMHQHVAATGARGCQASSQQLNQLLLPNPWPNAPLLRSRTQIKGRAGDGTHLQDESF